MKTLFTRCYEQRLAALCLFAGLSWSAQAAPASPAGSVLTLTGQVTDASTHEPVPYASLSVAGTPAGTVADALGRFQLKVPAQYSHDSLRVVLAGYRTYTASVQDFQQQACPTEAPCVVALVPQPVQPADVAQPAGRVVRRTLGNADYLQTVPQLFPGNAPGIQVGQPIRVKRRAQLEEVSFLVARCTYEYAFFRLNVYPLAADGRPNEQRHLLPASVYVRVDRSEQAQRVRLDLRQYGLTLEPGQEVAVCLELVSKPGSGELELTNTAANGFLLEKYSASGPWTKVDNYGAGIAATVTELR